MSDLTDRLRTYVPCNYTPEICLDAAHEIERLVRFLKSANDQAEHFEREWYLRGDELEALQARLDAIEFSEADRRMKDSSWSDPTGHGSTFDHG